MSSPSSHISNSDSITLDPSPNMATASSNNNSAANNNTSTANPSTPTIAQITLINSLATTAHDCIIMYPSKKALKAALISPTDAELDAFGINVDRKVEDVKEGLRGASKVLSSSGRGN
ncbi:hypothetical protein M438DRAFT_347182 [Aureobasidium pullulans EXF-150]|uniref:Uncharacterized protein n=1 Tax=Aureobasidium pullulans EXF-150 TaxID=1043002 RepID=A0A074Y658_AURPU|nr:uncharacterized protein M438DRAFT_347182 [Aureobasidium pullulans EXF-150]KEQ82396.1 hypothetical protein M438DRAFT_347182 [Aureobasidium pullulans EXF-150]